MPWDQFDNIRRGLLANAAQINGDAAFDQQFNLSPYFKSDPELDHIQVSGQNDQAVLDVAFRSEGVMRDQWFFEVEALIRVGDTHSSLARADMATEALRHYLETDARLTSRWQDDNTVLTGQTPAADDLHVTSVGVTPNFTLSSGKKCVLCTFTVEVWT